IQEALRRTRGRKAQAARLLGVSRPTLDAKLALLGIEVPRGAPEAGESAERRGTGSGGLYGLGGSPAAGVRAAPATRSGEAVCGDASRPQPRGSRPAV